jgi:hypothetical protein
MAGTALAGFERVNTILLEVFHGLPNTSVNNAALSRHWRRFLAFRNGDDRPSSSMNGRPVLQNLNIGVACPPHVLSLVNLFHQRTFQPVPTRLNPPLRLQRYFVILALAFQVDPESTSATRSRARLHAGHGGRPLVAG